MKKILLILLLIPTISFAKVTAGTLYDLEKEGYSDLVFAYFFGVVDAFEHAGAICIKQSVGTNETFINSLKYEFLNAVERDPKIREYTASSVIYEVNLREKFSCSAKPSGPTESKFQAPNLPPPELEPTI